MLNLPKGITQKLSIWNKVRLNSGILNGLIITFTNELLNCKILIINSVNSKTKRPTDGERSFKGNDRKSVDGPYASENVSTLGNNVPCFPFGQLALSQVEEKELFCSSHCHTVEFLLGHRNK